MRHNFGAPWMLSMRCIELLALFWTEMYSDIIISKQHQTYELGMKPQICFLTHQPTCIIKARFVDSLQWLNTANCWISLEKCHLRDWTRVETPGATVRLYLEKYEPPTGDLTQHQFEAGRDNREGWKTGELEIVCVHLKRSQSFFGWCTFLTIHVLQNGFRSLWHFCDTCT